MTTVEISYLEAQNRLKELYQRQRELFAAVKPTTDRKVFLESLLEMAFNGKPIMEQVEIIVTHHDEQIDQHWRQYENHLSDRNEREARRHLQKALSLSLKVFRFLARLNFDLGITNRAITLCGLSPIYDLRTLMDVYNEALVRAFRAERTLAHIGLGGKIDQKTIESLLFGRAVADNNNYSYPPEKRRQILKHYHTDKLQGRVSSMDAWSQFHYGISGRTLRNYLNEASSDL